MVPGTPRSVSPQHRPPVVHGHRSPAHRLPTDTDVGGSCQTPATTGGIRGEPDGTGGTTTAARGAVAERGSGGGRGGGDAGGGNRRAGARPGADDGRGRTRLGRAPVLTEGNRLRRYDLDTVGTGGFAEDVLVGASRADPVDGRDINGEMCFAPTGRAASSPARTPVSRRRRRGGGCSRPTGPRSASSPPPTCESGAEPFGCEFAPDGALFTSEVGFQGFGTGNGS